MRIAAVLRKTKPQGYSPISSKRNARSYLSPPKESAPLMTRQILFYPVGKRRVGRILRFYSRNAFRTRRVPRAAFVGRTLAIILFSISSKRLTQPCILPIMIKHTAKIAQVLLIWLSR